MKKIVRKVLLPFLFSFCFVFSGFLNVSVFAADVLIGDGADGSVSFSMIEASPSYLNRGGKLTSDGYLSIDLSNQTHWGAGSGVVSVVSSQKIDFTNISKMTLNCSVVSLPSPVTFEQLYFNFGVSDTNDGFPLYFIPNSGNACFPTLSSGFQAVTGVTFPLVLNCEELTGEYYLTFGFSSPYISSAPVCTVKFTDLILYDNDGDLLGIVDVIEAIKDQYKMEDGENFGIDDVISQHNDKMGVLSFGSDVMIQFLDMFQNTNPGTAQLTLPGFAITVQNVEYQVWQDQTFNFNQLETWFPSLIDIIRLILPAFVWLMVLRYCIGVFERNFLSK